MIRTANPTNLSEPNSPASSGQDLREALSALLVGQPQAVESIVPYVEMYQAGLAPAGRPAGVFFLLGPTGTGKTRTVEALAQVLHGSERNVLKINCGEFQLDHEVAKLIGAPPGYLGHRETHPMLSQQKLAAATSERCSLALVLFDEIEKAAPSMHRLLLGVLDKAQLRLGDNTQVNFEHTLIFMSSNVGAKQMQDHLSPGFGFAAPAGLAPDLRKLDRIAQTALKKTFSPEFLNRVDAFITYHPLDDSAVEKILDQQLEEFQELIHSRLGTGAFHLEVTPRGRAVLLAQGVSAEYGARELKRTLLRNVIQPLGSLVACGNVPPASRVVVEPSEESGPLRLTVLPPSAKRNNGRTSTGRRVNGPLLLREIAS